ncbi:hypothetical protein BCR44DRAFT_35318, partial [Catenaria anguillulae PL171]
MENGKENQFEGKAIRGAPGAIQTGRLVDNAGGRVAASNFASTPTSATHNEPPNSATAPLLPQLQQQPNHQSRGSRDKLIPASPSSAGTTVAELASNKPQSMGWTKDGLKQKPTSQRSRTDSLNLYLRTFSSHLHLTAVQAWREAIRNKGQYLLGFGVVLIAVTVTAVLMGVVSYASLIFLGLAEYSVGEIDMQLSASDVVISGRVNYTRVCEILPSALDPGGTPSSPYIHSPRMPDLDASLYVPATCRGWNPSAPSEKTFPYTGMPVDPTASPDQQALITSTRADCNQTSACLDRLCSRLPLRAKLQLIDTERDRRALIGKAWTLDRIPKGSVVLKDDVAQNLRLGVGDYVILSVSWASLSWYHMRRAIQETRIVRNSTAFSPPIYARDLLNIPVRIHAIVPNSLGKLNQGRQSLIFMEYDSIIDLAADHLHPWFREDFTQQMKLLANAVYHSVPQVLFTRQIPRFQSYAGGDFNQVASAFLEWGSNIRYRVGFSTTWVGLPVLANLASTEQLSAFVGLIMSLIIVILGGLSAFLIYCLLMVSVETKTFELAVLRMVGMQRETVLLLIVIQALSYSMPALILGLLLGQGMFVYVGTVLADLLGITISPILPGQSILIGLFMGLVVPIVSSIAPIQRALGMNLHDSLDRYRPVVKATTVTIERSNVGFDPLMGVIGFILAFLGFGIYYFLPLALLNNNLGLLFNIFLVILIGMVTGLVFLGSNFLQLLESMFTSVMFGILFMENRSMPTLVDRNLLSHRGRNRKTSMLYALSLSFIIFISVTATIEVGSLQYTTRRSIGVDFMVYSDYVDASNEPMGISARASLERYAKDTAVISGTAWVTWPLEQISSKSIGTQISNFGRLEFASQNIYGVSPGFYDLMGTGFLTVDQYDPAMPAYSPSEQLYTKKGVYSAVTGNYYKDQYSLQAYDQPYLVTARYDNPGSLPKRSVWPMWPLFFAKTSPVFTHSDFPNRKQDLLVSIPTFLNLTQGRYASVQDLPYRWFFVKLAPGATRVEYNRVKRELQAQLAFEDLYDIQEMLRGSNQAMDTLSMVFEIVTALVMLITFFSLNTSFYVNVTEQAKEIGILRALGLSRLGILRLYFYESLVLVLSSVVLGCSIGTMIGWTIAAQRTVLTETPITFQFPTRQVLIVVSLSIASAFFSTISPVYMVVYRRPLVRVLKE